MRALVTPLGGGLRRRLLLADLGVVAVGLSAVLVTTWVVSPALFTDHLTRAGETDPAVLSHAEEAFTVSLTIGAVVGLVVSAVAATAVALVTSRRLTRPFGQLAAAADEVAHGRFDVTVPDPGIGLEARRLAESFQGMAGRLSEAEHVRRRHQNDLAHELRSPLATLIAQVEALEDGVLTADGETLTAMRTQLGRLDRLVADLRTLAETEDRVLALHPAPVDLVEVVGRSVEAAVPRARARDVGLAFTPTGDQRIDAVVDADRVGQIVGNLLDNALRHTAAGGAVAVTVGVRGPGHPGGVVVHVHDTGEGIDAQDLPRVFDRLYRADTSRRHDAGDGSGLGLTISRALARAMGGDLEVHSDGRGQGTRATLTLPGRPATGGVIPAGASRRSPSTTTGWHPGTAPSSTRRPPGEP